MLADVMEIWRKLTEWVNIDMIIEQGEKEEIVDYDHGIRKTLLKQKEKNEFLHLIERADEEGMIYYVRDYFDVEYCVMHIPEEEKNYGKFILMGPYRDDVMNESSLKELIKSKSIPAEYTNELKEYYNAVPIIETQQWRELCCTMYGLLYGNKVPIREKFIYQEKLEAEYQETATDQLSYRLLEERYEMEEKLLNAVSAGDFEASREALKQMRRFKIARRYQDPVRDIRNGLVILGTLCRKAAEQGGVHPFYIDELSTQLSKRIELVISPREAERFMAEILRKYCHLVQNESLRGCSPILQKVVNHINLNLSEPLSLKMLAKEYNVNASYLSTLFKKEMDVTCSDYISQRRLRKAIKLFNTTNMQITDVASECGIYDVNYFRKIFKKSTGITPTQYLTEIKKPYRAND